MEIEKERSAKEPFFLSLYKEIYRLTADVLEKKASPDSRSRLQGYS